MQVQLVGMAWYRPETFERLRAMFEDGHKLHKTYEEWHLAAETGRRSFEAKGMKVVCVDIDPDQFPEWCKASGLKLNAGARNSFAAFIARKAVTGVQDPGGVH